MPHWNLDGMLLNRLRLELARAVAPEQDFHPQDADRLVAIGRGSATWPAWPGTTPSSRAGSTRPRMQFANQISGVLEAYGEAGEGLVFRAGRRPDRGAGRRPQPVRRLGPLALREPLERSPAGSVDVEECPLRTMFRQLRVAPGTLVVAAAWRWTGVGLAMLATTAVFVAMAAYVWRRRGGSAGVALALVLVALLLWAGTYAAELGPPT